ncbi:ROK family transcriptional regulator [uncultured Clostridium sp.]|uniref:ROK family transcriptional regulator n=1 Tax=uncultured Clostridium sp. TaxID=59620 RepID=UPI0028EE6565|nr:ROK family transcriptional regulator [uncultured Clostridium sp.]
MTKKELGNMKLMKKINKNIILDILKSNEGLSRADISKITNLSKPSISSLMNELINEGWVFEEGRERTQVGRRPMRLKFNSRKYVIIGAMFTNVGIQLALGNLLGEIMSTEFIFVEDSREEETVAKEFRAAVSKLLEDNNLEMDNLMGISMGIPGIVKDEREEIMFAPEIKYKGILLKNKIESWIDVPIFIDNDVNLMCLGEYYNAYDNKSKDKKTNMAYIYFGNGIGAGLMINGELYRGADQASGEIGYMVVGNFKKRDNHEQGVFESNYSSTALRDFIKDKGDALKGEYSIIKYIVEKSSEDESYKNLLNDIYLHWSYAIANLISIINPEVVILGGEALNIGEEGIKTIEEILKNLVPFLPKVKFGNLGNKAGIIGSIYKVLSKNEMLVNS